MCVCWDGGGGGGGGATTVEHGENLRIDWEDVSGPSRPGRAWGIGHKV